MDKIFLSIFLIALFESTAAQGGRAIRPAQNANSAGTPVDYTKFRIDADSGKHIRLGTTDKCPDNMRFFAMDGNATHGMCDCDYYQCSRPSIYSPKTKNCYFAWSKGPCAAGEWFTFDGNLKPVCERRGCTQGAEDAEVTAETVSLSFWFKNPEDGKCYESGSQGYCQNEDETLLIAPGEPIPICRNVALCVPLGRPEPQLCFPGNRRQHLNLCGRV